MAQNPLPEKKNETARTVRPQESVLFFRGHAHYSPAGDCWHLHVRGCIYSPSPRRFRKQALLHLFKRVVKPEKEIASRKRFLDRAHLFLHEAKKGKTVPIAIAERAFVLPETHPNGHFETTITIQATELEPSIQRDVHGRRFVQFCAHLPEDDQRIFTGEIELISPEGISIISDVDDTIKVTNVGDRKELLANTFTREFRSVPGMPELFRNWAASGTSFHYVSASPWPLYSPLVDWMDQDGFPVGTMHLRHMRLRDLRTDRKRDISFRTKLASVQSLLRCYPHRKFILCGDSGERDAELYAEVTRDFGSQIAFVAIRDCSSDGKAESLSHISHRLEHLPPERWMLFRDAEELASLNLQQG